MASGKRPLRAMDTGEGYFGFKNKFFHFQGETLDGKPHGQGLLRLSNGVTVQGEFVKGELKGPGTKRWPDGGIFYGTFENGEPHGFGRHFSVASLQDFEGYYERGYKKGFGTLTDHAQGTVFTGEFNRDFPNGKGELMAIGGTLTSPLHVKGYWENGKLHGLAMATLANGDTAVGVCEDGLWTGHGAFSTCATPFSAFTLGAGGDSEGLLGSAADPLTAVAQAGAGGSYPTVTAAGTADDAETANAPLAAAVAMVPDAALPLIPMRSAISYKGPFVEGSRAEVPDALKLRSAVLLANRAPLEKLDPNTPPGEGGMYLWGLKPPASRKGVRSPLNATQRASGRLGASATFSNGLPPQTPKNGGGSKGTTAGRRNGGQPQEDVRPPPPAATMLYSTVSHVPLRLQVSLAAKTYRTYAVGMDGNSGGDGMMNGNGGAAALAGGALGLLSSVAGTRNGSLTGSTVRGRDSISSMATSAAGTIASKGAVSRGTASSPATHRRAPSAASSSQNNRRNSPMQSPKKGGGGTSPKKGANAAKKGGRNAGKRNGGEEEDEEEPVFVTEEVITFQRGETGRRLFARLYNIRHHMQLMQQTAEDWAEELAREEKAAQRRAAGVEFDEEDGAAGSDGDDDSDGDGADEETELGATTRNNAEGSEVDGDENGNGRRISQATSYGVGGVTPAESAFSPRSTTSDSGGDGSSAENTPRGKSKHRKSIGAKSPKNGSKKDSGKGASSRAKSPLGSALKSPTGRVGSPPTGANAAPAPPPPTKSEMLLSLMRYLSPTTLSEAMSGKRLPPGVFETVFGVGGTPPRGTPRRAGSPVVDALMMSSSSLPSPIAESAAPPPSVPPMNGRLPPPPRSAQQQNLSPKDEVHSSRPHSADGPMFSDRPNSSTAANNRAVEAALTAARIVHQHQQDRFEFPTAEELSGVCQDGTASFEFFLPSEGEFLLEVFASDYVQLSPGNESHVRELAASTFVPFVASAAGTVANTNAAKNAGANADSGDDDDDSDEDEEGGDDE